jgi:hypothetical protein
VKCATAESTVADTPHCPQSRPEPWPHLRSWDFFVQVSLVEGPGEGGSRRGALSAHRTSMSIVESEFIPAKGGTWYRVRLGPYESSSSGQVRCWHPAPGMIPERCLCRQCPPARGHPRRGGGSGHLRMASRTAPVGDRGFISERRRATCNARSPGHEFEVIEEPLSGWAVKVSSLKRCGARPTGSAQADRAQGYAPFVTRSHVGGATWYRVMVGPFASKRRCGPLSATAQCHLRQRRLYRRISPAIDDAALASSRRKHVASKTGLSAPRHQGHGT